MTGPSQCSDTIETLISLDLTIDGETHNFLEWYINTAEEHQKRQAIKNILSSQCSLAINALFERCFQDFLTIQDPTFVRSVLTSKLSLKHKKTFLCTLQEVAPGFYQTLQHDASMNEPFPKSYQSIHAYFLSTFNVTDVTNRYRLFEQPHQQTITGKRTYEQAFLFSNNLTDGC